MTFTLIRKLIALNYHRRILFTEIFSYTPCIMQIRAEPRKSALPICNYSQILYQFLTFTQNLKRSPGIMKFCLVSTCCMDLWWIVLSFYCHTLQRISLFIIYGNTFFCKIPITIFIRLRINFKYFNLTSPSHLKNIISYPKTMFGIYS